jgi:hypothetical protein
MNELGLVIREGASRVAAFSIEYIALTSQHYIFLYILGTSRQFWIKLDNSRHTAGCFIGVDEV